MNEEGPIDFPQHAVSNKELRDASVAAAKKLNAFNVRIGSIWLTSVICNPRMKNNATTINKDYCILLGRNSNAKRCL